jgi:hypothetical protein
MQVASGLETVRDINVASRLIGDVFGSTLDDPLSQCYKKLGCSINRVVEDSEDYKMILKYLEKTYEPVKVGDVVRCQIVLHWTPIHFGLEKKNLRLNSYFSFEICLFSSGLQCYCRADICC